MLGLTACDAFLEGSGPQSPFAGLTAPEVTDKAIAATRAATSVRLAVTTESADGSVQVFVAAGARGACTGTFSMGSAGTMEPIRADGAVYTKSDEAMLRAASADSPGDAADDAEVKKLTGRWVKARPDDRRTAESLRYCDPQRLLDRLAATSGSAHMGARVSAGGRPTLTLTGTPAGGSWTASVAAEGTPYVLKMRVTDRGRPPLTVEFSAFGEPVPAKRPAAL
ncbi:hypothetical protein F0344_21835 [Streptomyces finlayi]|uniref:Lipoprotein n=1 Tax=Streptomyces finlayi TaxID=67296 RepID=A0A7G7BNI9_9ACTN|nr:hypothetical protein [Streptomyces finlayi]QNE76904.1 hypothetical protein F0344_21835 [Streptomyces finlayi]